MPLLLGTCRYCCAELNRDDDLFPGLQVFQLNHTVVIFGFQNLRGQYFYAEDKVSLRRALARRLCNRSFRNFFKFRYHSPLELFTLFPHRSDHYEKGDVMVGNATNKSGIFPMSANNE
jgi:hypothetical protein